MITKNKNFIYAALIVCILPLLLLTGCTDSEPIAKPLDIRISILDGSGLLNKIYNGKIPNVNVTLKSLETGRIFTGTTDNTGSVVISWVQPGSYDIVVKKSISEEEMLLATGLKGETSLNGQKVNITLNALNTSIEIVASVPKTGSLLISEVYYTGAKAPPTFYYSDQFTELYNNTDTVMYVDGLILAQPAMAKYGFITDTQYIHCVFVWQFPGTGRQYPIQPGGFIIVAQDAIDHRPNNSNSLDLSNADFEYFNDRPEAKDVDNPAVKNMVKIRMHDTALDVLYSVSADAMILCRVNNTGILEKDAEGYLKIPVSSVLDGVEWLKDNNLINKKLLPSIDFTATGGIPMYSSQSVERKTIRMEGNRKILSDINNSAIDFETLSTPTPRSLH
jgi:hypothetical protein